MPPSVGVIPVLFRDAVLACLVKVYLQLTIGSTVTNEIDVLLCTQYMGQ